MVHELSTSAWGEKKILYQPEVIALENFSKFTKLPYTASKLFSLKLDVPPLRWCQSLVLDMPYDIGSRIINREIHYKL